MELKEKKQKTYIARASLRAFRQATPSSWHMLVVRPVAGNTRNGLRALHYVLPNTLHACSTLVDPNACLS